jgi:hypothetical protein
MSSIEIRAVDGSRWVREKDYRALERELVDARAALRDVDAHGGLVRFYSQWRTYHYEAIKAAQKDSP